MEEGINSKGTILTVHSDSETTQWAIGSRMSVNGFEETYEVALCNDKIPMDLSAIIKIVPHGVEPLPLDFKFYLDIADTKYIGRWKNVGKLKNVGLPDLLVTGTYELNEMIYQYIIMTRYEKDVWSLFLKNGRKMNEHTVYKIGQQMISTLQYIHNRSWIHGDIKGSNIMVDPSENHICLVNYHFASQCATSNTQIHSNKAQNVAVEYMSRDAHMGVSTMRGDIESLFYNLVQWLGGKLPWEKNLGNPYLVKQQKDNAFANVDQFLRECFGLTKIPGPIRNFMNKVAIEPIMKQQNQKRYANFKWTLRNALQRFCHVPTGNLHFSLDDVSDDMEGSSETKQNKSRRGCTLKLGASVDLLAKIISQNCKSEKEVNLQEEVVSGSLAHAIFQVTRVKWSQKSQDRLAMAWEQDIEGLKTKTKKLWALKMEKRATNNTASMEKEPEKLSQVSPAAIVVSGQLNDELNHSVSGNSFFQSYFGATRLNETPAKEDSASLNPPNFFPPSVPQDVRLAPSSSRSNLVQSPLFRKSSSGYSSRCSSRIGFLAEDLSLFRTPDSFIEKEPYPGGSNLETVAERWRSESWHDNYELLDTWLDMKEKDLKDFDPIPPEPRLLISLVRQVQVLLVDFRTRDPQIQQLSHVLAKLPPKSADAQKLIRIQKRWQEQIDWLKERGLELGETSLGQLREALQNVLSSLNKLLLDSDPEEQLLRNVETLAGQLEGQQTLLASAQIVTERLGQAFSDATFNADLQNELQSVKGLYDDLHRRINVKKDEVERSLTDGRQFDDSCKKIIVWLVKERDMSEKLIVSADPVRLQQLQEHYKRVMGKEAEVDELLKKGRDFLSRPQNLENVNLQQSLLGLMKSQWDRLKKNSLQISSRLQICTEHHDNYCQAQKQLEPWLNEIENKLRSLQPSTFDVVEEALTGLSSLRMEIGDKLKEFEQYVSLGDTFTNACDEDKNLVKMELIAMKDRWKKLINDVVECSQFLKDAADRFNVFNSRLKELERRLDKLKSRHALLEEEGDSNLIDCIIGLRDEVDLLRGSPLNDVRQLADELSSIVGNQRLDTNSLLEAVDRQDDDIKNFRIELVESLNKAYEQKIASIENDIKPTINNVQEQDMKLKIPLPKADWKTDEVIDLSSDSEAEIDIAYEEKSKNLLFSTSTLPVEVIYLVSGSENEFELVTQEQARLEPRAQTYQNEFGEVLENDEQSLRTDNLEQKSEEITDVDSVPSCNVNDKSENSKKKRKKYRLISSDDSSTDYDEETVKIKNSRNEEE